MKVKFIEATNQAGDGINWGKFMVARFDQTEWDYRSALPDDGSFIDGMGRLLAGRGWEPRHILVLDLQTGEGAIFRPGGSASADLHKHKIWVCPLFEPFLGWLYQQDLTDLDALPPHVDIKAEGAMYGYRRPGPGE